MESFIRREVKNPEPVKLVLLELPLVGNPWGVVEITVID
jgi:hypothetical protein